MGKPRESRLGLAAAPARLPVDRLGRVERAAPAVDLTLAVKGGAARNLIQDPLREPLGRSPGLVECVLPRAPQLQDLGPVYETQAVVGDHPGRLSHHRVSASVHSRAWSSS